MPTNEERAQRARAAVLAYRQASGIDEIRPRMSHAELTGLLTDLMHLANKAGLNFDSAASQAQRHYLAESAICNCHPVRGIHAIFCHKNQADERAETRHAETKPLSYYRGPNAGARC